MSQIRSIARAPLAACALALALLAGYSSSASAQPAPNAPDTPSKPATMIPGPGSITLVVVAGGCMVYGRKRRHGRA